MELKQDRNKAVIQKGDIVEQPSGTRYLVDPVTGQWRKLPPGMPVPLGLRVVKREVYRGSTR